MFSRPLPELSCRLNAWVTMLTCQWLMGPCKVRTLLESCASWQAAKLIAWEAWEEFSSICLTVKWCLLKGRQEEPHSVAVFVCR